MKAVFSRHVITLILLISCCPIGGSQNLSGDPLSTAADLFHQQEYEKALGIWNARIQNGKVDAALYYNIGLAESALGMTPQSILSMEKAKRLNPRDKDIRLAIESERMKMENAVIPLPDFFLTRWYLGLLSFLRPGVWAFAGLCFILTGVIFILSKQKINSFRKKSDRIIFSLCVSLGFFFLLAGCLSYAHIYQPKEGIVFSKVELQQAPSSDSPVVRIISPGEKVIIEDQLGDWVQVFLLNLEGGWIPAENVEMIIVGR